MAWLVQACHESLPRAHSLDLSRDSQRTDSIKLLPDLYIHAMVLVPHTYNKHNNNI